MHRGYIKLWRKSLEAGWIKNHKLWAFWCYCLMKSTHKDHEVLVGFNKVELKCGQFVFGRKVASQETGLSEQEIRTCLRNLIKLENLTIKSTNRFSVVTIENWADYQADQDETTSTTTCNQPASNQQVTTYKNKRTKEQKNKNNTMFDRFYEVYPKKVGKISALKAWNNIKPKPTEEFTQKVIEKVIALTASFNWTKQCGKYRPNPASWLNAGGWDDEITEPQSEADEMSIKHAGALAFANKVVE